MKFVSSRRFSGLPVWCGWTCLLLVIAGCGGPTIARTAVSGNVTLNGQPLEEGMILFSPAAEGPSAGGQIVQGKYEIPQDQGPGYGKYRVEIRAYRSTGKQITDEVSGTVEDEKVSIVPARYNTQSTLEAQVEPSGPNQFDFSLTSQ